MAKWSEEWEFDFSNPPKVPPPNECDRCGQRSLEPMPFHVSKYMRGDTQNHQFCSRECHDEFYLDRLRTTGL